MKISQNDGMWAHWIIKLKSWAIVNSIFTVERMKIMWKCCLRRTWNDMMLLLCLCHIKLSSFARFRESKRSRNGKSKKKSLYSRCDDDDDENVLLSPFTSFFSWLYVNHISKIKHISQSINLSSQQYIHFPFTIISRVYTLNYDLTENLLFPRLAHPHTASWEVTRIQWDFQEEKKSFNRRFRIHKTVHEVEIW